MSDLRFSRPIGPVALRRIAERAGTPLPEEVDGDALVHDIAALDRAGEIGTGGVEAGMVAG